MEKYSRISEKGKGELLKDFCETLSVLKTPNEILNFLTDLLTKQEIIMLAKRIKTAKFLIAGKDYRYIENVLKISHSTIARINQWLMEKGEGFRLISERTKKDKEKSNEKSLSGMEWKKIKRRYPLMFWPQLLMEDIVKVLDKRQKMKIKHAVERLNHKSKLYKQITHYLT